MGRTGRTGKTGRLPCLPSSFRPLPSHLPRRWTRALAIVGISLLTMVVSVLALLQLPPVATWVARRLVTLIPLNPGYELEVRRVSGDWLHRLALDETRYSSRWIIGSPSMQESSTRTATTPQSVQESVTRL
jgi:hypothetical protein